MNWKFTSILQKLKERSIDPKGCSGRKLIPDSDHRLCIEELENRVLLSANGLTLDHGVLAFHGSDTVVEAVTVDYIASQSQVDVVVDANGTTTSNSFEAANVAQIRFVGKTMDDSLVNNTDLPVESLMSHGDHPSKMLREMEAMFDLVRYGDVTRQPVQSGQWLDPATWGGAENFPGDGDRVLIPGGVTITVDDIVAGSLMNIRVDGTLRFSTSSDSELRVDTLIVNMGGTIEMGAPGGPIQTGVTAKLIIDDFNGGFETADTNSPDYDPFKLGNGLISHGRVTIQGAEKASQATLAVEPSAGDTQLQFDALPANWSVGDEITIAGTDSSADGDELRTIAAINHLSGTVTLSSALANDHRTPAHTRGGLELRVHVGNITRNAIIETAVEHRGATGTVTAPTGDFATKNLTGDAFEERGHVMFMHSNNVEVRNAGFHHLGRTNKLMPIHDTEVAVDGSILEIGVNPRARYPIHFHRAGTDSTPGMIKSSAVTDSPGWGFVNHSSYVDMTGNVAYDVNGAGFVTEAGNEAGSFVGNLSIRNHGSELPVNRRKSVEDFGHSGHGFWLQGTGVTMRDNVASGSSDLAYVFWPIGIDGLGDTVRSVTISEFLNNSAYGSDRGLLMGQHHDAGSELVGTTFYGINSGFEFFYPKGLTLRDTTIIGDLDNPLGTGIISQHRAGPFEFYNTHIEGFEHGFETPRDKAGNVIDGVYLNNVENFVMINGRRHHPLELTIRGDVQFGTLANNALAGRTPFNFVLEESESDPTIPRYNHLVLPYSVTLDYNSLENPFRVYFDAEQGPDHIVWPLEMFEGVTPDDIDSNVPLELRGKTNAELQTIFNATPANQQEYFLSNENWQVFDLYPDSYYAFGGEIRPADSELTFRADASNGAFRALDAAEIDVQVGGIGDVHSIVMNAPAGQETSLIVTVTNAGAVELLIEDVTLTGSDFELSDQNGLPISSFSVAANDSRDFTLTLLSSHSGQSFREALHFHSRDADESTYTIDLVVNNAAPVAADETVTTLVDTPITANVLANDTDGENDALTITGVGEITNGSVIIVDNSLVYTPNAGFRGDETITYTVTDHWGAEDSATLLVTVQAVPGANDDAAVLDQDQGIAINVLANDSDLDGDSLSVSSATQAAHGRVSVNSNQTISYMPAAGFVGSDMFSYTTSDGRGGESMAFVSLEVLSIDQLVVDIDFNDGTATDQAADNNDNSGIIYADATVGGGIVTLDGTGGMTLASSSVINKMSVKQRTISLSFFADEVNSRQVLYEQGAQQRGLVVYIDDGRIYVGAWDRKAGWDGTFLSTEIESGRWHSAALVLDASNVLEDGALRGYLDGELFAAGAAQRVLGQGSNATIGSNTAWTVFHDGPSPSGVSYDMIGQIDEMRIYNRVLDDAELASLAQLRQLEQTYSIVPVISSEGLVVDIDFNDGSTHDHAPDAEENSGIEYANSAVDGGALTLQGSGGISLAGSSVINQMTVEQRTISLSFFVDDVTSRQVLYEQGAQMRGLNIYIDNGQLYVGAWDRNAGWEGTFLSTSIESGRWYSVALVLDATDVLTEGALRGYLDGQLFASGSAQRIPGQGSDATIGSNTSSSIFHDGQSAWGVSYDLVGQVDEFRIYNRVLDEEELDLLARLRSIESLYADISGGD